MTRETMAANGTRTAVAARPGESRTCRGEPEASLDRRSLLRRLLGLGAVAWLGGSGAFPLGCSEGEPACYDPELLSTAEQSARRLRGYVDRSPKGESKSCGGCAFFESGEAGDCGRCKILDGPVSALGLCEAWAAEATG